MASVTTNHAATAVNSFINTIGVNVHTQFGSTSYANLSLVEQALSYLGVHRLRDGIPVAAWSAGSDLALAALGYKFDYVLQTSGGTVDVPGNIARLDALETADPGSIVSIEGANEVGLAPVSYDGGTTIDDEIALQAALYNSVHDDALLAGVPVLNFTLGVPTTTAYNQLGDLSSITDEGSAHVYAPYGLSPAYDWSTILSIESAPTANESTVITETGYSTLTSSSVGVDQLVQAKYTLNILMDAAQSGVDTYLYELLDDTPDPTGSNFNVHFGLFNTDGTPKLAATAVHNLFTILQNTSSAETPLASPAGSLAYSVNNIPASGGQYLFQKANGVFDLALWAQPTIWNYNTHSEVAAPSQGVVVTFATPMKQVLVYDPMAGTAPVASFADASSITVAISDHPLIVETTGAISTVVKAPQTLSVSAYLAQAALPAYGANGIVVSDKAANISAHLDALDDPTLLAIHVSDSAPVTATVAQMTTDIAPISLLQTAKGAADPVTVVDTQADIRTGSTTLASDLSLVGSIQATDGPMKLSVVQFLANPTVYQKVAGGVVISDSVGNIVNSLVALSGGVGAIASIAPTSGSITVSAATFAAATAAVNKITGGVAVFDTAANVQSGLAALAGDSGAITTLTASGGLVTVSASDFLADKAALAKLTTQYIVADSGVQLKSALSALVASVNAIKSVTVTQGAVSVAVSALSVDAALLDKITGGYSIVDTAAHVLAGLSALTADNRHINSVLITNSSAPQVAMSPAVAAPGGLTVSTATLLANTTLLDKVVGGFAVFDSEANVYNELSLLASQASHITSIALSGSGPALIALNTTQYLWAKPVLAEITSSYVLDIANGSGSFQALGQGDNLTLNIGVGMTKATGGGAHETFVLAPGFGYATLTDFAAHDAGAASDHVSLAKADFSSWAAFSADAHSANGGADTTFVSTTGHASLTLTGLSFAAFEQSGSTLSGDFTFRA